MKLTALALTWLGVLLLAEVAFGAETAAVHDVFPGVHEWHGTLAFPFIDKALGGHAGRRGDPRRTSRSFSRGRYRLAAADTAAIIVRRRAGDG